MHIAKLRVTQAHHAPAYRTESTTESVRPTLVFRRPLTLHNIAKQIVHHMTSRSLQAAAISPGLPAIAAAHLSPRPTCWTDRILKTNIFGNWEHASTPTLPYARHLAPQDTRKYQKQSSKLRSWREIALQNIRHTDRCGRCETCKMKNKQGVGKWCTHIHLAIQQHILRTPRACIQTPPGSSKARKKHNHHRAPPPRVVPPFIDSLLFSIKHLTPLALLLAPPRSCELPSTTPCKSIHLLDCTRTQTLLMLGVVRGNPDG